MKEGKAYIGDEKNIKDYLHLYLGCEVLLESEMYGTNGKPDKIIESVMSIDKDGVAEGNQHILYEGDFKLLLRPLSDMTGKEVLEVFHLSYNESNYKFSEYERVDNNEFGWRARNQNGMECFVPANSFKPEVLRWLLSKHFDLFGLIESGLAIDKTTLNKQS